MLSQNDHDEVFVVLAFGTLVLTTGSITPAGGLSWGRPFVL
jgi:hypothetical protein